jgi:hypothetical protein
VTSSPFPRLWAQTDVGYRRRMMSPRTVGGDAPDGNDASTVRTLITGMSAVGKSSVISELIKLRHRAIDLDTDEWSQLAPDDSANAYGKNPAELRREPSYAQLSSHCCVAPPA